MIYIILSDIHSNLQAFEAVIGSFPKEKDVCVMSAGDIVGYGANPVECVNIVREREIKSVLGNHDAAVVGKMDVARLNEQAAEAVEWTCQHIGKEESDYLKTLPFVLNEKNFTIVHGTLHEPEVFDYVTSALDAEKTFKVLKKQICFLGHSHRPGVFMEMDKKVYQLFRETMILEDYARYIINVGSVGQPRDRDNRACYCIYYPEEKKIEFRRVEYDIRSARSAILKAGLPRRLGDRLLLGQ